MIERELYDDLVAYVDKKDRLLAQSAVLVEKITASSQDTESLRDICKKIESKERENLEAMIKHQDKIKIDLHTNSANKKFLNAYASAVPSSGNILDCIE